MSTTPQPRPTQSIDSTEGGLFRALVENAGQILAVVHPNGTLRYLNPAVERTLGWTPAELIGKSALAWFHPDDVAHAIQSLQNEITAPGSNPATVYRVRHRDGSWRYIEMLGSNQLADPDVAGIVISARDVTAREEREAVRRGQHERAAALVRHATDIVAVHGPDGAAQFANPAFERVLGYPVSAFVEGAIGPIIDPADWPRVRDTFVSVLADDGRQATVEYRVRAANGEWRYLESFLTNCIADPHVNGLVVNSRDVTERVHVAELLRHGEERFRRLFLANPLPMWVFDMQTFAFLEVNDAAVEEYGYTRDEFLRLTMLDIVPASQRGRAVTLLTGPLKQYEHDGRHRHRRKDGSELEAETSSFALTFEGQDARLVVSHDVTARVEAEAALRASEERLRLIVDQLPVLVWTTDRHLRITYAAGSTVEQLGFDVGQIEREVRDALDRSPDHPAAEAHRRALAGEAAAYMIPSRGGHIFQARVEPLRDGDGRVRGTVGGAIDITEQQQAQAALAAREQFISSVIDALPVEVAVLDRHGTIVAVNAAWRRLAQENGGRPEETGAGVNYLKHCRVRGPGSPDDSHTARAARRGLRTVLQRHAPEFTIEYPCPAADRVRWFSLTAVPLPGEDGGAIVIHTDITEQRDAERGRALLREQQAAAAAAIEADQLKTDLINTVSHELRTPLSAITGFASMLSRFGDRITPEERDGFVAEIEGGAGRLAALVDDLLEIGRWESGGQTVEREPADLAEVVRAEVESARRRHPGRRIGLAPIPPLPASLLDVRRVGQVLSNLLTNAIKFSPDGGRVRVRAWSEGDDVLFSVADRGIGIAREDQPRVFDRFYRASQGRAQEIGGTGLGLAIARAIVEAHGGAITLRSTPGRGTTFTVRLPVHRTEASVDLTHPSG